MCVFPSFVSFYFFAKTVGIARDRKKRARISCNYGRRITRGGEKYERTRRWRAANCRPGRRADGLADRKMLRSKVGDWQRKIIITSNVKCLLNLSDMYRVMLRLFPLKFLELFFRVEEKRFTHEKIELTWNIWETKKLQIYVAEIVRKEWCFFEILRQIFLDYC